MRIDLEQLEANHPRLPRTTAREYVYRAALALQRRHVPGVEIQVVVGSEPVSATLLWVERSSAGVGMLDTHRVTEDGAEAIALGLVYAVRGWVVIRRLQREECADWLLYDNARTAFVALEVSGTDDGNAEARMADKLKQVMANQAAEMRAACVVRFLEPRIALRLLPEVSP